MIEILVSAREANKEIVLRGRYGKGFPIVVKSYPCAWGGCEGPPDSVKIRITDSDDMTEWTDPWRRITAYEILQHDPVADFFRVKIFPSDKKSASALTVEEMQQFLLDWGAEKIESDEPDFGVLFELTAMDAINHRGLFTFGEEDTFIKYNEIEYDMVTGMHKISMDYANSTIAEETVRGVLTEAQMDIVSVDHEKGICIFIGYRHKMIGLLEKQVAEKFHKMLTRVRWRFSDNVVADALANGGLKEMTLAEAEADMLDVAEEV